MRQASAGGAAPDRAHLGRLDDVRFRPVFIMGSARSGTTILYRLLTLTGHFNYVTAYHLVQHDELLANHFGGGTEGAKKRLAERFVELGIAGTRFDGVEIDPDFPEEYGFRLGPRQKLGPKTLPTFLELCRKVQVLSGPSRPLLLKNPWDSRRFLYIKRVLPDSRFVFIHRNPADVVPSLLDGLRSLLRARNAYHALLAPFYDRLMERPLQRGLARALFSPRLGLGARLVEREVARTARYFVDHVGALADQDYLSVRYEDLCQDSAAVIHQILAFLGLPARPDVKYQDFIRVRPRPRAAPGNGEASGILKKVELQPYLIYCGYEAK